MIHTPNDCDAPDCPGPRNKAELDMLTMMIEKTESIAEEIDLNLHSTDTLQLLAESLRIISSHARATKDAP